MHAFYRYSKTIMKLIGKSKTFRSNVTDIQMRTHQHFGTIGYSQEIRALHMNPFGEFLESLSPLNTDAVSLLTFYRDDVLDFM